MIDKNLVPETIPFDFDETYKSVKDILVSYGYDIQEGSNAMQIAIAMSYLTSMLNANTAVNINEMLLPLARKRKMVLQNARLLGYEIRHKTPYKYKLKLEFPEGTHSLPRYSKFTNSKKTYVYMGDSITSFEGPRTIEIEVQEGTIHEFRNNDSLITSLNTTISNEQNPVKDYFVDVPFSGVAEDGLRVFVSYVDISGHAQELVEFKQLDSFLIDADIDSTNGYIRLDNIEFNTPRVYFKLGNVGMDLPENTKVYIDALVTSGADGAMESLKPEDIKSTLECEITEVGLLSKGAMEESSESVKRNAVLFHNSANRLVTKEDYRGFINRDVRVIDTSVWTGMDEYPRKPGNIWFTALPESNRSFSHNDIKTKWELNEFDGSKNLLSDQDIQEIYESMEDIRIPTLKIHHRQPVFMDFDYIVNVVRYTRSLSDVEWNETLFNVINEYFISDETKKGAESLYFEYFQSNLIKRIDTKLGDISGMELSLENYVKINSNHIIDEEYNVCGFENKNVVIFHLGTPFERFLSHDNDGLIKINTSVLPRLEFSIGNYQSYVDFENHIIVDDVFEYPIILNERQIGKYRLHTGNADTIEIVIHCTHSVSSDENLDYIEYNVKNNIFYYTENPAARDYLLSLGHNLRKVEFEDKYIYISDNKEFHKYLGIDYKAKPNEIFPLNRNILDDGIKIKVNYVSNNFKLSRNTIPSLRTVEFITR